jgi:hypothetical protein
MDGRSVTIARLLSGGRPRALVDGTVEYANADRSNVEQSVTGGKQATRRAASAPIGRTP